MIRAQSVGVLGIIVHVAVVSAVVLYILVCGSFTYLFLFFVFFFFFLFFFQAEDGIRDLVRSRGLGDVYKRQCVDRLPRLNGAPRCCQELWRNLSKVRRHPRLVSEIKQCLRRRVGLSLIHI